MPLSKLPGPSKHGFQEFEYPNYWNAELICRGVSGIGSSPEFLRRHYMNLLSVIRMGPNKVEANSKPVLKSNSENLGLKPELRKLSG